MPPSPEIHAHRGGPLVGGVPVFAEQTMPAFHHAALAQRAVLELDVKLTRDRVPVVVHDETIDRTTDGTGRVQDLTAAELRAWRADVLGTGLVTTRVAPFAEVPTFAEVLAFARDHGVALNVELKNLPEHADFDPTPACAHTVAEVIAASRFPLQRLQLQSFWPADLEALRERLPGATFSFLVRPPHHEGSIVIAAASGYGVIGPQWPVERSFVERAHAAGLRVIPFTLNTPADVRTAAAIGADGIITDDPVMARAALRLRDEAAQHLDHRSHA
jgi:glycerophosphoryl diester phosphodiesterase